MVLGLEKLEGFQLGQDGCQMIVCLLVLEEFEGSIGLGSCRPTPGGKLRQ